MQAHQNNLRQLNVSSVYNSIINFLDYKGNNQNTRVNYERDVKDLFEITKGKELSQLNHEDLKYSMDDVIQYRKTLQRMKTRKGENRYNNKSINRKMSVLHNLFVYLKSNDYDVNPFAFKLDPLSEKESQGSDYLTEEELLQLIELASTKENGAQKAIMIKLAVSTAIRLKALSNITWKDIKLSDGVYVVSAYDKNDKLAQEPIQHELYEELLTLKGDRKKTDKVFTLSYRTFQYEIPRLASELGIEKKITFHSLKKTSGVILYERTGDPELVQDHLKHANISTTFKNYVKIKRDMTKRGAYILTQKLDMSKLDEIEDIEVLKDIIRKASVKTQMEIVKLIEG